MTERDDDKPWLREPNSKWFESSGLMCVLNRNRAYKHWGGYVLVPRAHPWHGLRLDAVVEDRLHGDGMRLTLAAAMPTHCGLTFADSFSSLRGALDPGLPDEVAGLDAWAFGFDCMHAGDFVPGMAERLEAYGLVGGTYRTIDYVTGECARLAARLAHVARLTAAETS